MTRRQAGALLLAAAAPGVRAQKIDRQVEPLPSPAFDYRSPKFEVDETRRERRGEIVVRDITYTGTWNQRTSAYLVEPPRRARKQAGGPAILWVHWYEPQAKDSNRTQFLSQAVELAADGVLSLLPETMWSDPEWFKKRRPEDDYLNTIRQTHELRRALDLLQEQKDVLRLGFVGHDFGAMFGAVLPAADRRVLAFALQAGAPRWSDWYLLGRKLEDAERKRLVERFLPLDPVHVIGRARPARVLWQFGRKDPYVPEDRATMLWSATREPKDLLWYDAGHRLNDQAVADRQAWLRKYFIGRKT